jgi:formate/nitrite transporter FocA (FNT family)
MNIAQELVLMNSFNKEKMFIIVMGVFLFIAQKLAHVYSNKKTAPYMNVRAVLTITPQHNIFIP